MLSMRVISLMVRCVLATSILVCATMGCDSKPDGAAPAPVAATAPSPAGSATGPVATAAAAADAAANAAAALDIANGGNGGRRGAAARAAAAAATGSKIDLDRKSTRLNSSHTVISYAVFCLKKKK